MDKDISMDQSPTASEATLKGQADSDEMAASLDQLSVEDIDDTLYDINNSLAKQISEELEDIKTSDKNNKKRSKMMKIQIGVIIGLVSLLGFACFLGFTKRVTIYF